jgi:hypothetical protein
MRTCIVALLVVAALAFAVTARADSLEDETLAPPGTNSLDDDSERLQGPSRDFETDSLDDDSDALRGDDDDGGTDSLDDGDPTGGAGPHPNWPQFPNQ